MKSLISLLILLKIGQVSAQEVTTFSLPISDSTYQQTIDMNVQTVKCHTGDYGAPFLKIIIPDLKLITSLDHTVRGAGGPCITAGRCDHFANDSRFPILRDKSKPTEDIDIRVVKSETYEMDLDSKSCIRRYAEDVSSTIRGSLFQHHRDIELASMTYEACEKIKAENHL